MGFDFIEKAATFPPIRNREDIAAIEQTPWESYDFPASTLELIERTTQRRPNQTAMRFLMKGTPDENGITYSYSLFLEKVLQTANAFHSLGVGSQDVVSFMLPSLPQTHFTLWGGEAAGIINPINPLLEPEHIAGILNGAGSKVLVALAPFPDSDIWDKVEEIKDQVPSLETVLYVDPCQYLDPDTASAIRSQLPLPQHDWCQDFDKLVNQQPGQHLVSGRRIQPDDIASMFHTGGTTGTPKLAPHTHANEVGNACMVQLTLPLQADEVVLCGLPMFHVNATLVTGLMPLLVGAQIVLATPGGFRTPALMQNFWGVVEKHKVSFFSAVPAVYAGLLQLPVGDHDLSSLRRVLCGGSPLPKAVHSRFEELAGIPMVEGFGMTEGTCGSTGNPMAGQRKTGSIGLPLPYSQARAVILDDNGQLVRDCDVDETGTLIIRGPNVFKGYTDPAKNTDIWVDGDWFNTGDLARIDEDGYFWLTGRSKDLIIRGGHNIDPQMIEDVLHRHPAVEMAAAVGKPCDRVGELPVAYVSLNAGHDVTADALMAFCQEHIAERAAVPKDIWIQDAIPLTAVGKVFKPTLRQDAIRRVFSEVLSKHFPQQDYVIIVNQCKEHGMRADIYLENGSDADIETLAPILATYPVHAEFHLGTPA